jgi:cytoskeletal protein CcmA (bactofilin family)
MAEASVIGRETVVRGNVRGSGGLEILGRVEGDVSIEGDVLLGDSAAVRGNISGAQLTIGGAVLGDLRGTESVMVESGARVVGDLLAPRIGIAEGALVRGNVRTEGEPALAPPQAKRPAAVQRPVSSFSSPRPAASPARPAEVRPVERPVEREARPVEREARPVERTEAKAQPAEQPAAAKSSPEHEPPPPIVPALPKNARGKKKSRPK